MEQEQFNIEYFIKKFFLIPEKKWCVDYLTKTKNGLFFNTDQYCAQGHCLTNQDLVCIRILRSKKLDLSDIIPFYPEWKALYDLTEGMDEKNNIRIASINNGLDKNYTQSTPKQRVLAALIDIKNGTYFYTRRSIPQEELSNSYVTGNKLELCISKQS